MKRATKALLLEQLKKTPIVQIACEKAGVGRATYYRWRKEDPEFSKMADEAILEGSFLVNDMAETQLMSAIRDRNLTAIIFWLKHHHSQYTNRLEISGQITHLRKELTEEEKQMVEKALRLAMPQENEELNQNNGEPTT
ncbi:MAG: phBC6A51 family helix-turn-helix protein [bacterium]|nr:phBC6A51 family helix-turn-helix protein [bacterium]